MWSDSVMVVIAAELAALAAVAVALFLEVRTRLRSIDARLARLGDAAKPPAAADSPATSSPDLRGTMAELVDEMRFLREPFSEIARVVSQMMGATAAERAEKGEGTWQPYESTMRPVAGPPRPTDRPTLEPVAPSDAPSRPPSSGPPDERK